MIGAQAAFISVIQESLISARDACRPDMEVDLNITPSPLGDKLTVIVHGWLPASTSGRHYYAVNIIEKARIVLMDNQAANRFVIDEIGQAIADLFHNAPYLEVLP